MSLPPEPGVYRDVPMEEYNAWPCARASELSAMARGATPYEVHTKTYESSPSKDMGSVMHLAFWEPHLYQERVEVWTDTKTRAAAYKAHAESLPPGHYLITAAESEAVTHMCLTIRKSARVQKYLDHVDERELSVVFDIEVADPDSGEIVTLRTKSRLDSWIFDLPKVGGCIVDLKTTRNAKKEGFAWEIKKWGHHHQGAVYHEAGVFAARLLEVPEPKHHVILACQNEPTWRVKPYRLTEASMTRAWDQLIPAVITTARCYETGEWPDVADTTEDIGLPEEGV